MIALRFLHTADWQLGMTRHFLDADAQARFTDARLAAVRRIGTLAAAERCRFVVVAGDVFESNQLAARTIGRALEAMRTIPVPVYLLPGNHDPLDATSVYRAEEFLRHRPDQVHVLDTPGVHRIADDVELVAAPWYSKAPVSDLVADQVTSLPPADSALRIVVGHGMADTHTAGSDTPVHIRTAALRTAITERRVHYVALGDRHSVTDLGIDGRAWYSGTQEVTDYDEVRPGEALVVDLTHNPGEDPADDRCTVTPHRVGTWRFLRLTRHLDGAADVTALRQELSALDDKERTVLKLSLVGTLGLGEKARLDDLLDEHTHLFAALDHWKRHTDLAVLPDDTDLSELDLSGFAADALEEIHTRAAESGADAADAQAALGLLYRLARGAR